MREIKFRAWDRDGGFMHEDVLIDGDGAIYTSASTVYDTPHREIERMTEDKAYVMQYTGLKDKNGKEIYEGDIVRGGYDGKRLFEVYYDVEQCAFRLTAKNIRFSIPNELIEVIGNIYENPELIPNPQ